MRTEVVVILSEVALATESKDPHFGDETTLARHASRSHRLL
jgi:hypothetical protein